MNDQPMPIEGFELAWRWTRDSHSKFSANELATMEPIDSLEAGRLYELGCSLLPQVSVVGESSCTAKDDSLVERWLLAFPLRSDATVTIVWSKQLGVRLPWGIFMHRWDDFCYPSSDDAFIFLPNQLGVISYEHYELFRHVPIDA